MILAAKMVEIEENDGRNGRLPLIFGTPFSPARMIE